MPADRFIETSFPGPGPFEGCPLTCALVNPEATDPGHGVRSPDHGLRTTAPAAGVEPGVGPPGALTAASDG